MSTKVLRTKIKMVFSQKSKFDKNSKMEQILKGQNHIQRSVQKNFSHNHKSFQKESYLGYQNRFQRKS